MRFCCKIENFTKSAQFRSQNVSLVLTKKRVPTLYVSDHKQVKTTELLVFKVAKPCLIFTIVAEHLLS